MDTTVTFEIDNEEVTLPLFRQLGPAEEADFRAYARENYTAADAINPLWHPVIQDEMRKMGCK